MTEKMSYSIQYESNPNAADIQTLNDGIMEYAKQKKGMKQLDFFAFFIRDEEGHIVGGCAGDNMYGGFLVGQLWVVEPLRGKDYGTKLMQAAEKLARESKCRFMAVNTMDWEALDFYKKLGFYVEFERKGFDKNSVFYFLRKDFGSSDFSMGTLPVCRNKTILMCDNY
jgi:GNAT superfamily N-acetyltransferase